MSEREWQRSQFIDKHRGKKVPIKTLGRMYDIAWSKADTAKATDAMAFSLLCGYTMALSDRRHRRKVRRNARV